MPPPPRSASRDRSDRHTDDRRYFHTPDWLRRWKLGAIVGGCVLTLAWVMVELFDSQASSFHTHGVLANPHAAWDNDCAACHKAHGVRELWSDGLGSFFDARDRWHDLTCNKCHTGPAHHPTVKDAAFNDKCSNCHHDHAGRTTSLTRISDDHCTNCHHDLPAAHMAGAQPYENVTDFASGHPEFKVLRQQEGGKAQPPHELRRLKFSHALHMTPGMVLGTVPDEKKNTPQDPRWSPASIKQLHALSDPTFGESEAKRYAVLSSGDPNKSSESHDPITLKCVACHQLDSGHPKPDAPPTDQTRLAFERLTDSLRGESLEAILPPRAAGAYYLPINFEAHCRACHPLRTPDGVSEGAADRRIKLDGFPIPHRIQPADLKVLIDGAYAGRLTGKNPDLAIPPGPGGRLDPATPVIATFRGEVDRLTDTALQTLLLNAVPADTPVPTVAPKADEYRVMPKDLYGGYACGKCHFTTKTWTKPIEAQIAAPPPGHTIWFSHAIFNHVSHRGVDCSSCHPGTGKPEVPPKTVVEREPVAILGVDSCRACHAPTGLKVTTPDGLKVSAAGVRHSCTDCHRYHNTDRPLQGLGATARDPVHPQPLGEFLPRPK